MSDQAASRSVLFVCTANQCRSPMSDVLLKSLADQRGEAERWQIQSAGTWADPGRPATPLSKAVMQRRNLDLSSHLTHIGAQFIIVIQQISDQII